MNHRVTEIELQQWIDTLCSPVFRGRLSGTPEYKNAAEWAAEKFKSWGLAAAGGNRTWYQWFPQPYTRVNDLGSLKLLTRNDEGSSLAKSYTFPDQYYPGMNSGSGSITAEVVFAGYGITAPEHHYDDYADIDVRGKIVLVSRDAPYKNNNNPDYADWVNYCYHQYKIKNAVSHGAAGFLYVDGNAANPNSCYDSTILVAGIGAEPLNDLFAGTGMHYDSLMKGIDLTFKPASCRLNKMVSIRINTLHFPNEQSCNILGLIPGNDPLLKDECIILGAHFDAVGSVGNVFVPGGLDNGSGSADLMAVAKMLSERDVKLKRSVLFILLGGEETGLLGSKHYTRNPVFPLEKTTCFINLDMAGNGTSFWLSTEDSLLLKTFEEVNRSCIHREFRSYVSRKPDYGRPRSDAVIFTQKGYTTVSLGINGEGKKVFYHLPGDGADAVTTNSMYDLVCWLALSVSRIANR